MAQHRVHPRPHDAAEDDELDPVAVEQDVGDVEGVGDDRQPAVGDLAGEGEGGRAAADRDRRVVGDALRGGAGDGSLRVEVGVAAGRGGRARAERGAAVGADEPAVAGQALEVPPDRGWGDAEVVGQLGDARPAVGTQVLDQARATLRLPHARILRNRARIVNAGARTAHSGRLRARKLRTGTRDAYDAADGLPAWRRSRPGRVQLAERHLHRAGPRPPPEPAQGAASGGSGVA